MCTNRPNMHASSQTGSIIVIGKIQKPCVDLNSTAPWSIKHFYNLDAQSLVVS